MKILKTIGLALVFGALSGLFVGTFVEWARASHDKLPVASHIWTAGQIATSTDINNLGVAPTGFASQVKIYTQTITPASVAANVCAEQTFTVTGLATTDKVFFNPVAAGNATSAGQVRVSATDTLAVTYCNPTAGALTPGAGSADIVAVRKS